MQAQRTRLVRRNGGLTVAIIGLILATTWSAKPGWASSGTTASAVLGQINFSHNTANTPDAQSMYTNNVSSVAVDKVGGYLYVSDGNNNRVLGFSSISALTNGEAAALVIGQPDFETTTANSQPEPQKNLYLPTGIAVDSNENLYVADYNHNRILVFSNPFATMASTGQTAGFSAFMVIGQGGDFSSTSCNVGGSLPSQSTICDPNAIAIDASNNLWVADAGNNRVLEFDNPVGTNNLSANLVLGQPNFTSNLANQGSTVSATTLYNPAGVAVDSNGNVYVSDYYNQRALEFNAPSTNDPAANQVWGQGGLFTTSSCDNGGVLATSLCYPIGIAVDGSNNVYIADWDNSRVLEFNESANPPTNVSANVVLGQQNATTSTCVNSTGLSASVMCEPSTVAVDSSNQVFVVDSGNNRTLQFNPTIATGEAASVVLGQPDFTHNASNNVDAGSLYNPFQVAVDTSSTPSHLYVADFNNNRVLGWLNADSFANGGPADFVLGQPDFLSRSCNQATSVGGNTLCEPVGVAVDARGNLYVSDYGNSRALEFTAPIASCGGSFPCVYAGTAHLAFGQTNFTTGGCNSGGLSDQSLCEPQELALDSIGNLYIADYGNNRVLEYNTPLAKTRVKGSGDTDRGPGVRAGQELRHQQLQ